MPIYQADYYPIGVNLRVPAMQYASDVAMEGLPRIQIGIPPGNTAPATRSTTFLAAAVQMVNGSAVTVLAAALSNGGVIAERYGCALQFVASTTNTRVVTIQGFDYLGQPMTETVTLTSGTIAFGKKAFKRVTSLSFASASDTTTVDVGNSDVYGLPYRALKMYGEFVSDAVPSAGTFVAGLATGTAATISNADVRGTWTPAAGSVANGTRTYSLTLELDRDDLHGQAQFTS